MKAKEPDWAQKKPYALFFDFIAPNADRYTILLKCIEELNLKSAVIPVGGNRHIFIFPPKQKTLRASGGIFPFSGSDPFLFSAHYDRVAGSPGANDNSIAVFHLLTAAYYLSFRGVDRWIIVFTDKEELNPGESFEEQGSYSLAVKLKSWGLEKAKIYNFDVCGAGNAFIFSTTTDAILKTSDNPGIVNVRNSIRNLRDYALVTANNLRLNRVLLAPTLFSDDVGFLRAGLAAQTITILPEKEADQFEALIRSRPEFVDLMISGKVKEQNEYRRLPETWRILNGPADVSSRLTPEYFDQFVKFILQLADKSTAVTNNPLFT